MNNTHTNKQINYSVFVQIVKIRRCFVTIMNFARTDLKNEKGSDTPPPERAEDHSHLHFIV